MRRLPAALAALGLAGLVSLVIALTALASPRSAPAAAHPGGAHALATRVVVRRRVVTRCRRVAVRRDGRVVRHRRVCRRVVVRVRVRVPVRPPATTTVPTASVAAPAAPPPAPVTDPGPGTTTAPGGGTTVPDVPLISVRVPAGFEWPPSPPAVPAGPVRFRFQNDATITHGLSIRRTDGAGGTVAVVPPGGRGTTGEQTLALTPGTYQVFCPVPGHGSMTFTLTVA
jgi:hypothetical protein